MSAAIKRPIEQIQENPSNPRFITEGSLEKLVQSLKDFPEMLEARPIVVDKEGVVLGGNMRLRAAKEAGLTEVPVYVASWEEIKHKQFVIKDNVSFGSWDFDALTLWDTAELGEWGLEIDEVDLDLEGLDDGFALPEGEKEPFQSMTFVLADDQAEQIKEILQQVKASPNYDGVDQMGNENKNGNALYLMALEWAELKR